MAAEEGSSFDMAAAEAANELQLRMEKLTPDEKKALILVVSWIKKWYMTAGLKRLGRIIRDLRI